MTQLILQKCIILKKFLWFQKHENDKHFKTSVFKCDHCDSEFNDKWKMNAHLKKHEKHKCEQCDKTFKYLDINKKHILVSHENVKLFATSTIMKKITKSRSKLRQGLSFLLVLILGQAEEHCTHVHIVSCLYSPVQLPGPAWPK